MFLYSVNLTEYVAIDPRVSVCVSVCLCHIYSPNEWTDFDKTFHKPPTIHLLYIYKCDSDYFKIWVSLSVFNFHLSHLFMTCMSSSSFLLQLLADYRLLWKVWFHKTNCWALWFLFFFNNINKRFHPLCARQRINKQMSGCLMCVNLNVYIDENLMFTELSF